MAHPTTVNPLDTIKEKVVGEDRLRIRERARTGAVVLFAERMYVDSVMHILLIISVFSLSIFFDRF
jgi:hypothetical protein